MRCRLGLNDDFHKPLLKSLVRDGKGIKRLTDQGVPRHRLDGVRSIITKKGRGKGVKTHDIIQQAKGLEGRPGILVNLGGSHVEFPKDTRCEPIKGERHV